MPNCKTCGREYECTGIQRAASDGECLECWINRHPEMERHLNDAGRELLQRQRGETKVIK
jgi:hypothetical protein